jgi:hypothetical protein
MLAKSTINLKPANKLVLLRSFVPPMVFTKTDFPVSGKLPVILSKSDIKPKVAHFSVSHYSVV